MFEIRYNTNGTNTYRNSQKVKATLTKSMFGWKYTSDHLNLKTGYLQIEETLQRQPFLGELSNLSTL